MRISTERPGHGISRTGLSVHIIVFCLLFRFCALAPPSLLYRKSSHARRSLSPSSPVSLFSFSVIAFDAHSFPPSRARIVKPCLPPPAIASGGKPSTMESLNVKYQNILNTRLCARVMAFKIDNQALSFRIVWLNAINLYYRNLNCVELEASWELNSKRTLNNKRSLVELRTEI